jgi:hypothetical protein
MCDHSNAQTIVEELTTNLATADVAIREEMVLKIAILAERYATDLRWCVPTGLPCMHACMHDVASSGGVGAGEVSGVKEFRGPGGLMVACMCVVVYVNHTGTWTRCCS